MAHGGREDCWSEGATAALVDAWGERFLELSRGNLRQKDWKDVADAVNSRQESLGKPTKTDVQCKNRIDTLKKKYKTEKTKPGASQWSFFARLDMLVGSGSAKKQPPPEAAAIACRNPSWNFATKPRNPNPSIPNNALFSGGSLSMPRMNSAGSSGSSGRENGLYDDEDDEVDGIGGDVGAVNNFSNSKSRFLDGTGSGKRKWEGLVGCSDVGGGDGAFSELTRAIIKFAEVYERVESSKQQQLMELEKKRMEFAKEMEFQRMQMFMEAQLELEKLKRPKYTSGSAKRLH